MAIPNAKIAEVFEELADLLEIEGANPFRVRAYRNAARTIASHPQRLAEQIQSQGKLPRLSGVGPDLEGKIKVIAATRNLPLLSEVAQRVPSSVRELLRIPGLGPKRIRALRDSRGIQSLRELEKAAKAHELRTLPGFGAKTEERILTELARQSQRQGPPRLKLSQAEQSAEPLLAYLKKLPGVDRAVAAGSYRRRRETVGDLDFLITCESCRGSAARANQAAAIMDRFTEYEEVAEIVSKGETRSTVLLRSGLQVDLRVVAPESYGAALVYFTGSKAHNIAIRNIALKRRLKINEYGIYRGARRIAGRSEEDIYRALDLRYIEPELREDRGELEAAARGTLPRLLELDDIRGDLHGHTVATDGQGTLEEMTQAARARGYEYFGITDHSRRLTVARGQTPERLRKQLRAIDQLNARLARSRAGLTILKSAEVDILEDGSLDFPDELLRELDYTVCSIHSRFDLSGERQTERILRAMDNPWFTILGHPSGRLIDQREPYAVDLERIIRGARERGCFLEVNAQPDRLDLTDVYCKAAKDAGVLLANTTDSHSPLQLQNLRLGVGQARRGWLEAKDVLNTRPLKELWKLFRRR